MIDSSDNFIFKTPQEFSLYIENEVIIHKISHVDAILMYCKDNFIDPEDIAKHLSPSLIEKLKTNFYELNYFPKVASLEQYL